MGEVTNVAVFDLPSAYWPVAESVVRSGRSPEDVPGAVVEHLRALTDRCYCQEAVFAVEHKPYWRSVLYPAYKAGRIEKDPALREQYERLTVALQLGGACVVSAAHEEREDYSWYEADDVCASVARRIVEQRGLNAVVVSDDHDLAQCLPDYLDDRYPTLPGDMVQKARVYLARATLAGGDRWVGAEDVVRRYGVPPSRMWEHLALAGDGDFRPYDGLGPKTARDIAARWDRATLREVVFDSHSVESYLEQRDRYFAHDKVGVRVRRALEAVRAAGAEHFELAGRLARLRDDADVSAHSTRVDWDAVRGALAR